MWTDRLSSVFAALSLAALAIFIVVGVLSLLRWRRNVSGTAAIDRLQPHALWLAWLTAALMTAGSLYFIAGAEYFSLPIRFLPNTLGWYQCVCVMPLTVVLLIAAVRKDAEIWQYAAVPVILGLVVAIYNTQLQARTTQVAHGKFADGAAERLVWKFGFVSLPLMAVCGFLLIGLMLFVAQPREIEVADAD